MSHKAAFVCCFVCFLLGVAMDNWLSLFIAGWPKAKYVCEINYNSPCSLTGWVPDARAKP